MIDGYCKDKNTICKQYKYQLIERFLNLSFNRLIVRLWRMIMNLQKKGKI